MSRNKCTLHNSNHLHPLNKTLLRMRTPQRTKLAMATLEAVEEIGSEEEMAMGTGRLDKEPTTRITKRCSTTIDSTTTCKSKVGKSSRPTIRDTTQKSSKSSKASLTGETDIRLVALIAPMKRSTSLQTKEEVEAEVAAIKAIVEMKEVAREVDQRTTSSST